MAGCTTGHFNNEIFARVLDYARGKRLPKPRRRLYGLD